jgi:hypothetical protein
MNTLIKNGTLFTTSDTFQADILVDELENLCFAS